MTAPWFSFELGFANEGPDGDTVRHILGVLHGDTVRVSATGLRGKAGALLPVAGVDEFIGDVVVDTFDQDDVDPDYPVFLTGWLFDEAADDADFRGARVRIPLANSKLTIL